MLTTLALIAIAAMLVFVVAIMVRLWRSDRNQDNKRSSTGVE
jgi:hypothetical protein